MFFREHLRSSLIITVKFLNFRMPKKFDVIYLKFKQRGQILNFIKMMQMDNGIANSEDPDHSAPLGAV